MGQIELLTNLKGFTGWEFSAYHLEKEDAEIVIDALEKQQAKYPVHLMTDGIAYMGYCPVCGKNITFMRKNSEIKCNYCPKCGQKIEWKI